MTDERWQMTDDRWRMTNGKWQMANVMCHFSFAIFHLPSSICPPTGARFQGGAARDTSRSEDVVGQFPGGAEHLDQGVPGIGRQEEDRAGALAAGRGQDHAAERGA